MAQLGEGVPRQVRVIALKLKFTSYKLQVTSYELHARRAALAASGDGERLVAGPAGGAGPHVVGNEGIAGPEGGQRRGGRRRDADVYFHMFTFTLRLQVATFTTLYFAVGNILKPLPRVPQK